MSRCYGMNVTISGYNAANVKKIKAAAEAEWPFEDWLERDDDVFGKTLSSDNEGSLGGGETEEEFTERLSLAIWRANAAYCDVTVDATYLDELPCETHCLDEADYARLIDDRIGPP